MKKIVFSLLACLPLSALAQSGQYILDGAIGTYNAPAKVYLEYHPDKSTYVIDSATVNNGKFKFEGKLPDDPIMARLLLSSKGSEQKYDGSWQVYLENGTTTIIGPDIRSAIISGTQTNLDNARLDTARKALQPYYDRLNNLQNTASAKEKQTDAYKRDYDKIINELIHQQALVNKKFIQENPDSYISLVLLGSYAYSADYSDIAPLYDGLSDRMKQTLRGKHFAELLPHLKAVSLGAIAPEFAEPDTAGKMVSLSSFRGKYVLVDFWASWCGPCCGENPNVVKAFNRYKGQNFTIVGVSLDSKDGRARWLAAIHKDGLPWTQVSALNYWDDPAAALYAVKAIPQNFLLDPNGKIIAKNLRGDDLENKLEELFGKI